MIKQKTFLHAVLICMLFMCGCGTKNIDISAFYVAPDGSDSSEGTIRAPFATVARAQQAVRELKKQDRSGSVTVYLRGGLYELSEPLRFGPEDSGTDSSPICYRSYSGETAVISGGVKIDSMNAGEDGIWRTTLDKDDADDWNIWLLYSNGELRSRPRLPREGYYKVSDYPLKKNPVWNARSDWFIYSDGDIDPLWENIEDVVVVSPRFWVSSRQKIKSVDESARTVTFRDSTRYRYTDDVDKKGARYCVENVKEAFDEPGEWYYDRKSRVLSYFPKEGEAIESTELIVPRVDQLLLIEGNPLENSFVEHLSFENLTFSFNNWSLPKGKVGERQSAPDVEGAFVMKGARNCTFSGCSLSNLSSYAVEIGSGCMFNSFTHNELGSLGGGGFRIGGGSAYAQPQMRTGKNSITDNHIHHIGLVHHAATGIWIQHSFGNLLAHNHIHHTYYSSIAIGWVWGYARSISSHNIIEYNHIHDVGQGMLSDMGGIYLLGEAPGTVVRNNLFHDIQSHGYGGWGIYTDEGSSDVLIENNIVYRTKCGGFHQHYGCQNVIRNNIFANSTEGQIIKSRTEPHLTIVFENNIVYWNEGPLLGGNWSGDTFEVYNPFEAKRQMDKTYELDYNVYYNPAVAEPKFKDWTFEEWKARGRDTHSIIADPLFSDPENGDFTLSGDSPALKLGFIPIDMSTVGPRFKD